VHVLITADTLGGVWTYTRELACGLIDRGHTVTLVSFGQIPSAAEASWTSRKNLIYHPTSFPLEWMQNAEDGIAESARHLTQIVRQSRPDVLHLGQFCYGALEIGIPKVLVAHSDVRSWWQAVHGNEPPSTAWMDWYTEIVGRGLNVADAVVAPSSWMLEVLKAHYQLGGRCGVIHNGRNPDLFSSTTRKNNTVLSVGRVWDEAKQIRLLLAREQCMPLGIVGSAEHPEGVRSDSSTFKWARNCTFWGKQDEPRLSTLYGATSIYAATSRYEPFGLAPVEAAFSRCALIANDIPTFRELWGDAAFYFERNNADSLAEAIRVLSQSTSLQEELGERAYECACARFGSARMVTDYEHLYSELTGKGTTA
jgi:glycogen synthase